MGQLLITQGLYRIDQYGPAGGYCASHNGGAQQCKGKTGNGYGVKGTDAVEHASNQACRTCGAR